MKTTLKIGTMNCQNCVNHITKALDELNVEAIINLKEKLVTITHNDEHSIGDITNTLENIGYKAEVID